MITTILDGFFPNAAAIIGSVALLIYYWRRNDSEKLAIVQQDVTNLRQEMKDQGQRHTEEVSAMRANSETQGGIIQRLQAELINARMYISMLRGILADRGIPTPDPTSWESDTRPNA